LVRAMKRKEPFYEAGDQSPKRRKTEKEESVGEDSSVSSEKSLIGKEEKEQKTKTNATTEEEESAKSQEKEQANKKETEEKERKVRSDEDDSAVSSDSQAEEEESETPKQSKEWTYLDDENKLRGPFTLSEMLTWWFSGLLPPSLMVKKETEEQFFPVSVRTEFQTPQYLRYCLEQQPPQQQEQQQQTQDNSYNYYYYNQGYGLPDGTDQSAYYNYYYAQQQNYTTDYQNQEEYVDPSLQEQTDQPTTQFTAMPDHFVSLYCHNDPPTAEQIENERIAKKLLQDETNYLQKANFNKRTGKFQATGGGWTDSAGRQMIHYFDPEGYQEYRRENKGKTKPIKRSKKFWKKYNAKKKKKIPDYLKDD